MIGRRDEKGRILPKYTKEQRKWIVKHQYSFSSVKEFFKEYEKHFKEPLSLHGLYGVLREETGVRSIRKVKGKQSKDWDERIAFLKEYYPYQSTKTLTKTFNKRFGTTYSEASLRDFCNNNGIRKDSSFHREMPKKPIGHIIKGYIKVKDDNVDRRHAMQNYMPINRYIYEQHYGKIPEGYKVLPYDGDSSNTNINNLYIANKREILWLNNQKCLGKGIFTKAALENIRLEQLLIDKGVVKKQKFDPNRLAQWNIREKEKRRQRKENNIWQKN